MPNKLRDRAQKVFGREPLGDEFVYGDEPGDGEPRPRAAIPKRLALAIAEDGALDLGNFRLTKIGLDIAGVVTEEQWNNVGKLIQRIGDSIQWLIGDWMAYGEREWGKTYEAVAAATGLSAQTLYDYAWVARSVEFSLREEKLTFGHHKLITSFEPELQQKWLQYAADENLSISQMRKAIEGQPPTLPDGKDVISKFERVFLPFQQRINRVLRKAGQGDRRKIANWLRQEADRIERGDA